MTPASPVHDPHRWVHRLAHAVYGLIILTATIGEFRLVEDDPVIAIALVAGGAAVLVIAHTYSQVVASAATTRTAQSGAELRAEIVDELPLGIPAVIAVGVLALAHAGAFSLDTAYDIVLFGSLAALFVLGLVIGLHRHRSAAWGFGVAAANVVVGGAIVAVESAATH